MKVSVIKSALFALLLLTAGLIGGHSTTDAQTSAPILSSGGQPLLFNNSPLIGVTSTVAVNGYDGAISINGSGQTVNGHSNALMLRGTNLTCMYFGYIKGPTGQGPWDNYLSPCDPNWVFLKASKVNTVRIPLNVQSWLGLNFQTLGGGSYATGSWNGVNVNTDAPGNTQLTVELSIILARQYGIYPIIDAHVSAPQFLFGGSNQYLQSANQPPAMDMQTYSAFWGTGTRGFLSFLCSKFGSPTFNAAHSSFCNGGAAGPDYNTSFGGSSGFADVIMELGNEYFLGNFGNTLTTRAGSFGNTAWLANHGGVPYVTTNGGSPPATPTTGGTVNPTAIGAEFVATFGGFADFFTQQNTPGAIPSGFQCPNAFGSTTNGICQSWRIWGTQEAVDQIRGDGFNNIIIFPVQAFSSVLSNIQFSRPTDSQNQLAVQYHAYQSGSSGYPNTADPGTGTPTALTYPAAVAAGTSGLGFAMPVFLDEIGDTCGPGQATDTYVQRMEAQADAATRGTYEFIDYSMNGGLPFGGVSGNFCDTIYGAPKSVTGSISNGSGGAGYTLNITAGTGILAGMAITNGSAFGAAPSILAFGSVCDGHTSTGTGGTGTYCIPGPAMNVGSTGMQLSVPQFTGGQGTAVGNWLISHPGP